MGGCPYVPLPYRSRHFRPWRGRHFPGSANVHASGGARGDPPRGTVFLVATPTNGSLLSACHRLGVAATIADPEEVRLRAREDDIALARLDVRPTLDGVEAGLWELRRLGRQRVRVLNDPGALLAVHDKLTTALRLAAHGIPHPRTAHIDRDGGPPAVDLPVVVKPRFGSWGRDVVLGRTRHELERVLRRVTPPPGACALALAAAAAVGADFVGVDLLPASEGGWVVLELNGAVDFTPEYALDGRDIFADAAPRLIVLADEPLAAPLLDDVGA
jgi:glutathione synthase/RimK-type ligase-like ATP-grasp enzyme